MNELYVKLMILCDEKHITPYRMCQDIQLRQSAISDLKHGRKEYLSLSNMLKVAKYFDVSLEWLRGEEERTPFYKGNEKKEEEIRPDAFNVSPDDFVDLAEVWNTLKDRPEAKILFKSANTATAEQLLETAKYFDYLKSKV